MHTSRTAALLLCAALAACEGGAPTGSGGEPEGDGKAGLGPGASLGGRRPFPDDNPWNRDVSGDPVDPSSAALIASCGADLRCTRTSAPPGTAPPTASRTWWCPAARRACRWPSRTPTRATRGPYPVPPDAPVEGGAAGTGDRHVIVVDRDAWKLYELFDAHPQNGGASWRAGSGAVFDLRSNALRPAGWTSADAAGLPIFPGLVRYDEAVERGEIRHALRFTCPATRRAYVHPARHFASTRTDPALPPMGMRVRLRADYDLTGFPPAARAILEAMKRYGMLLADNGSAWYVSGAPDPRWSDAELATLRRVRGRDFEVVKMGEAATR